MYEFFAARHTKPEYHPSLAIHAILSPQEGGDVYIKYTRPIDSSHAQPVPVLPEMTVFLYEKDEKKYTFADQGEGHFTLDAAGLELFSNRYYHIEVTGKAGNVLLKSGNDRLPSLPEVVFTRFYQDTLLSRKKTIWRWNLI